MTGEALKDEWVELGEYVVWCGLDRKRLTDMFRTGALEPELRKKIKGTYFVSLNQTDKALEKLRVEGRINLVTSAHAKKEAEHEVKMKIQVEGKEIIIPKAKFKRFLEGKNENDRITEAKLLKEETANQINLVKLQEKRGELVKYEYVEKAMIKTFNDLKEQLLNLPDQIGPELLACTDLLDLQNTLIQSTNSILIEVVKHMGKIKREHGPKS